MRFEFEKEYRKDRPETVGETDRDFDLANYTEWLEGQLESQRAEIRTADGREWEPQGGIGATERAYQEFDEFCAAVTDALGDGADLLELLDMVNLFALYSGEWHPKPQGLTDADMHTIANKLVQSEELPSYWITPFVWGAQYYRDQYAQPNKKEVKE